MAGTCMGVDIMGVWTSWGCGRHASNLQRLWSTHADQGVLAFALLPHCVNLMR